jgi:hypothetical protein
MYLKLSINLFFFLHTKYIKAVFVQFHNFGSHLELVSEKSSLFKKKKNLRVKISFESANSAYCI